MKSSTLQFGIIFLSAFLMVSAGILGFLAINSELSVNLLQENSAPNQTPTEEFTPLPLSYETRLSKGDQLYQAQYYELAAKEYALAIQIKETEAKAHTNLGETYLKLLDFDQAQTQFERALELNPSHEARTNLVRALIRNENFDRAQSVLAETTNQTQEYFYYSGLIQVHFEDWEKARTSFEEGSKRTGNLSPQLLKPFQDAYLQYSDQQGGQLIYLQALLVKALIEAEEYPLAEELALRTLNQKNDYRDVWILLGYSELQLKKFPEAEDTLKQAKQIDAVKPETHYFLGIAHFEQKEYSEAVDAFELALLYHFQPEEEAYKKLAESQTLAGHLEDALAAYEYLIKINRDDFTLFVEAIGLALEGLGDLDRALTLAKETSQVFPNESESYQWLAKVHLKRNELPEAHIAIEQALGLDPLNAWAYFTQAQIQLNGGKTEEAKTSFKKAYELADTEDALRTEAAEAYNALMLSPNP